MKRIILSIIAFIVVLAFPIILWNLQSKDQLQVAIVDKTVPTESYREHHGLTWLLNHLRYLKADGTTYSKSNDYFGFVPNETEKNYDIREIPASLTGTDLIYIADTYGVYEEDLPWNELPEETAPSLLYGGMEMKEWRTIKNQITENGSDLVIEFNSFASPTVEEVRNDITEFLGIRWTGWSGRYFGDLSQSVKEVPEWAISRFENSGENWNFSGPGFVLVHDKKEEIVVLSEQQADVGPEGIRLLFTEQGKELFSLNESPAFEYWFDINEPVGSGNVLANYNWDLTESGSAILKEHGIPAQFPAIMHHQKNEADVYFFGGDFVDIGDIPDLYQYSGFAKIQSLLASLEATESAFYWKTYVPVMKNILTKTEQKKAENTKEPTAAVQGESSGNPSTSR